MTQSAMMSGGFLALTILAFGAWSALAEEAGASPDGLKTFGTAGKAGMLYQVTVAGKSRRKSFLECCVRAYVDGAKEPLMLSSGLEDYFLGTHYFNRGKYYTDAAGLTHYGRDENTKEYRFSAYRFHEEDPVFYRKGLRLTLRNGEKTDRQTWNSAATTYTTYVWVYEWQPD